MKLHRILPYLIPALLLISCKKEDPATLFIFPEHLVSETDAGKVLQFNLKANSPNNFTRLIITSKVDDEFSKTELDSILIPVKKFNHQYEFLVPVKSSNYNINLTFRFFDQGGQELYVIRRLLVQSSMPITIEEEDLLQEGIENDPVVETEE
jgi:hypothetical protein